MDILPRHEPHLLKFLDTFSTWRLQLSVDGLRKVIVHESFILSLPVTADRLVRIAAYIGRNVDAVVGKAWPVGRFRSLLLLQLRMVLLQGGMHVWRSCLRF